MPRIRYLKPQLKDVSPIIIEEVENEDDGRGVCENDSSTISEGNNSQIWGREALRGWYNNANIIASLPASKIKQAITYHKEMLYILQQELLSRVNGEPRLTFPDFEAFTMAGEDLRELSVGSYSGQSRRAKSESKRTRRTGLAVKTQQFCKILEAAKLPPEKIKELVQCLSVELQKQN